MKGLAIGMRRLRRPRGIYALTAGRNSKSEPSGTNRVVEFGESDWKPGTGPGTRRFTTKEDSGLVVLKQGRNDDLWSRTIPSVANLQAGETKIDWTDLRALLVVLHGEHV